MECPVCKSRGDFRFVREYNKYKVYLCGACDVAFSDPMKNPGVGFYRDSAYYKTHSEEKTKEELETIKFLWVIGGWSCYHNVLDEKPAAGGRLLDIGCGDGTFLYLAKEYWDVWGMDINDGIIEYGRKRYGLPNLFSMSFEKFMETFPNERFDVVTMFEFIEHEEDPAGLVQSVKKILNPGGYFALSLPNRDRYYSTTLDFDYPPNHLTRWSKKAIQNFLTKNGFTVLKHKTTPVSYEAIWHARLFRSIPFSIIKAKLRPILYRLPGESFSKGRQAEDSIPIDKHTLELVKRRKDIIEGIRRAILLPYILYLLARRAEGWDQYILCRLE